jgi:hypothetical protein
VQAGSLPRIGNPPYLCKNADAIACFTGSEGRFQLSFSAV